MRGRMVLTVRPKSGARIEHLDSVLSQSMPAIVAKTVAGGRAACTPDSDGNFEVHLLDSSFEEAVKKLIGTCCFEVIELREIA